jgi:hypothetical protein
MVGGSSAMRISRRVMRRGGGRASVAPSRVALVVLLPDGTGVWDERAMECVGWDLRGEIAVGLSVDLGAGARRR